MSLIEVLNNPYLRLKVSNVVQLALFRTSSLFQILLPVVGIFIGSVPAGGAARRNAPNTLLTGNV